MPRNTDFGKLVSMAIKCIAALEDKDIGVVVDDLARELGRTPHAVEGWRRGHIPPPEIVLKLAKKAVEEGNLPFEKVYRLLALGRVPHPKREAIALVSGRGYRCKFLDDRGTPPDEIFREAQEYVCSAQRRVWVLNAHPREPTLKESLDAVRQGPLHRRVRAFKRLVWQHAYYEYLVRMAVEKPGEFEYIRIVQVPEGYHPALSAETVGYHYLYHFYKMLKLRKDYSAPGKEIKVLLFVGDLLRDTTFVIVDDHTLLIQITGVQRQKNTGNLSYNLSYMLRGLLIIEKPPENKIVAQFSDLFQHIRNGGMGEGTVFPVDVRDLEPLKEKGELPPLEEVILDPARRLVHDLLDMNTAGGDKHVADIIGTLWESSLPEMRKVADALSQDIRAKGQWDRIKKWR